MTGIVAHTYPEWWLKLTGQAAHWSTDYSLTGQAAHWSTDYSNAVVHNFELLFSNYSHFIDSRGSIMWNVKVINLIHVFGKEDAMDMIEKKVIQFVSCE